MVLRRLTGVVHADVLQRRMGLGMRSVVERPLRGSVLGARRRVSSSTPDAPLANPAPGGRSLLSGYFFAFCVLVHRVSTGHRVHGTQSLVQRSFSVRVLSTVRYSVSELTTVRIQATADL